MMIMLLSVAPDSDYHEQNEGSPMGPNHRGSPMDHRGPPMDHRGSPMDHRGHPMDHRGHPMDRRGSPMDHRGPPGRRRGPPNLLAMEFEDQGRIICMMKVKAILPVTSGVTI